MTTGETAVDAEVSWLGEIRAAKDIDTEDRLVIRSGVMLASGKFRGLSW